MTTPAHRTGRTAKLSEAQRVALTRLTQGSVTRGFWSGWGPTGGASCPRIEIREATANRLISLGLAERIDVEGDDSASLLRITDAGRAALSASRSTGDQS